MNIDSGPEGSVAAYLQDFLVKPPWSLLVWVVQSLLVGVEWSYTVDLLSSPQMRTVAGALRSLQHAFTQPLLALVLAFAAGGLAWRGLVRRQHSASLAEALTIAAMVLAGLAMVYDPLGTVGALGRLADEASIGTLASVVHGSPSDANRALADSATQVFESSILGPWCFMEFGNVAWCDERRQLDPQLHSAALALAKRDERDAASGDAQQAASLTLSARLLRRAQTNGAIFLAQPANGPARNGSKESSSLLHAICNGPSATQCHGPTTSQAEFRTSGFTIDRLIGLVMIWIGALGLILLLGFVVTRLLGAAVLSLLLLLCAPAAVLTPALGEGGRVAFRRWAARLLGSVTAKLVWSFVLGVVLASMKIVLLLGGFGWWVQWLLMSTLWWGAFHHRYRVLSFATHSEPARGGVRGSARGIGSIGRSIARNRWLLPWRGPRLQAEVSPEAAGEARPYVQPWMPGPPKMKPPPQGPLPPLRPPPPPHPAEVAAEREREQRAAAFEARKAEKQALRDEQAAHLASVVNQIRDGVAGNRDIAEGLAEANTYRPSRRMRREKRVAREKEVAEKKAARALKAAERAASRAAEKAARSARPAADDSLDEPEL